MREQVLINSINCVNSMQSRIDQLTMQLEFYATGGGAVQVPPPGAVQLPPGVCPPPGAVVHILPAPVQLHAPGMAAEGGPQSQQEMIAWAKQVAQADKAGAPMPAPPMELVWRDCIEP